MTKAPAIEAVFRTGDEPKIFMQQSPWYVLKGRLIPFFVRSLKIVLACAIAVAPLQLYVGHLSGEQVYHYQPTKLAAMEARWETIPAGEGGDWSMIALPNDKAEKNDFEIAVPKALGLILEFKTKLSEPVQGLKAFAAEDRPHQIGLIYYAFRIMIAIGLFFAALMAFSVLQWLRGKLSDENIGAQKWLMRAWILAAPLGYIATDSGWIVRCVGRQPWTVYGQIRTVDAASLIPAEEVFVSLLGFVGLYALLLGTTLYFGRRIIRQGPNLELPLPSTVLLQMDPAQHQRDQRPAEAQQ